MKKHPFLLKRFNLIGLFGAFYFNLWAQNLWNRFLLQLAAVTPTWCTNFDEISYCQSLLKYINKLHIFHFKMEPMLSGGVWLLVVWPTCVRFCCQSHTSVRHLKSLGSEVGRYRLHLSLIVNIKYSVNHFLLCRGLSFSSGDMESIVIEGFYCANLYNEEII